MNGAPCFGERLRFELSMTCVDRIWLPEDAKEAFGRGIRAKRSKSGAVSFEVVDAEADHAPVE
jgi:hypothetical protein